jgi:ubiquitin-protein ligase
MSTSTKRIQKELAEIVKSPSSNIRLDTVDDITKWTGLLVGEQGTPYHEGLFRFEITYPSNYPFKPPVFKFSTRIYHPNVDEEGSICLGILKSDTWKPATKMKGVLESILQLLAEPNPDDPLLADIAELFKSDRSKFDDIAREWTKKHAII